MIPDTIRIKLKSAATFGRGDGVAGLIDREIEHDSHGFPFLRGRTLKGLLMESAENVAYALEKQGQTKWWTIKHALFGQPGRGNNEQGLLQIGDAILPLVLRELILQEQHDGTARFRRENVLASLTGIRRQTAVNPDGGSDAHSLRAMRVLLRGVVLHAKLTFAPAFASLDAVAKKERLALLAAAVLDFRRAGTGRNRGRGWLLAELDDEYTTKSLFEPFIDEVVEK